MATVRAGGVLAKPFAGGTRIDRLGESVAIARRQPADRTGSEFRLHRHWFLASAMDELLNADFVVAEKDRLYRCLDRVLEHKQDLFTFLRKKWADLFHA